MTRTQTENRCLSGLKSQSIESGLPELLEIQSENPGKEEDREGIDPRMCNHPQIFGYSPNCACVEKAILIVVENIKWKAELLRQTSQFLPTEGRYNFEFGFSVKYHKSMP